MEGGGVRSCESIRSVSMHRCPTHNNNNERIFLFFFKLKILLLLLLYIDLLTYLLFYVSTNLLLVSKTPTEKNLDYTPAFSTRFFNFSNNSGLDRMRSSMSRFRDLSSCVMETLFFSFSSKTSLECSFSSA